MLPGLLCTVIVFSGKPSQETSQESSEFVSHPQVKSLRLLEEADCVIYDDLACQESLSHCQPATEVVYVGKRGGQPSLKQDQINTILVDKCSQYSNVRSR